MFPIEHTTTDSVRIHWPLDLLSLFRLPSDPVWPPGSSIIFTSHHMADSARKAARKAKKEAAKAAAAAAADDDRSADVDAAEDDLS